MEHHRPASLLKLTVPGNELMKELGINSQHDDEGGSPAAMRRSDYALRSERLPEELEWEKGAEISLIDAPRKEMPNSC